MVQKKTRRLVGNVTVWGGLAWLAYTNLLTYAGDHVMIMTDAGWNLVAVGAIIFGILWGLRG